MSHGVTELIRYVDKQSRSPADQAWNFSSGQPGLSGPDRMDTAGSASRFAGQETAGTAVLGLLVTSPEDAAGSPASSGELSAAITVAP